MKNRVIVFVLFTVFNIATFQAFAKEKSPSNENTSTIKITKVPFIIELPANMKEGKSKVDKNFYLYQFATSGKNDSSKLSIKMMAIRGISDDEANYDLWQTEALISSLTHLVKEYHLSMKNLQNSEEVLGSKGEKVQLGNNTYKGLNVVFGSTQAQFLNIIKDGVLYIFTLVSNDPDERIRKQNLEILMDQMKTIQFK